MPRWADSPADREARKASLKAAIDALPARRVSQATDAIKSQTDFIFGAYGIVVEAARGRRLSVAAYIRRAAYAMACHDLGIPLSEALERDPRMARETGFAVADPDGTKFGRWEIAALVGEEVSPDAEDV